MQIIGKSRIKVLDCFYIVCAFLLTFSAASAQTTKDIIAVYAENYPPYSQGSQQQVTGLLPSVVENILSEKMGLKVTHLGLPWARAQKMIEDGDADVIFAVPTVDRSVFAEGLPFSVIHTDIIPVLKKDPDLKQHFLETRSLSKLSENVAFCQTRGNGWQKKFYYKLQIRTTIVNDLETCIAMIGMGRQDITVLDRRVATMLVRKLKLTDRLYLLEDYVIDGPGMTLMVSRASDFYSRKFMNTLSQVSREVVKDLQN